MQNQPTRADSHSGSLSDSLSESRSEARSEARSTLPVVDDCSGCGVCCFHMGYPAFMMPVPPLTDEAIDEDPQLRELARDPQMREHLKRGHPGESYWHALPDHLKRELEAFLAHYEPPAGELEGPCIWFDMESRRCRHHACRPRVCRDFQAGSVACRSWRKVYRDRIRDDRVPEDVPSTKSLDDSGRGSR